MEGQGRRKGMRRRTWCGRGCVLWPWWAPIECCRVAWWVCESERLGSSGDGHSRREWTAKVKSSTRPTQGRVLSGSAGRIRDTTRRVWNTGKVGTAQGRRVGRGWRGIGNDIKRSRGNVKLRRRVSPLLASSRRQPVSKGAAAVIALLWTCCRSANENGVGGALAGRCGETRWHGMKKQGPKLQPRQQRRRQPVPASQPAVSPGQGELVISKPLVSLQGYH